MTARAALRRLLATAAKTAIVVGLAYSLWHLNDLSYDPYRSDGCAYSCTTGGTP